MWLQKLSYDVNYEAIVAANVNIIVNDKVFGFHIDLERWYEITGEKEN